MLIVAPTLSVLRRRSSPARARCQPADPPSFVTALRAADANLGSVEAATAGWAAAVLARMVAFFHVPQSGTPPRFSTRARFDDSSGGSTLGRRTSRAGPWALPVDQRVRDDDFSDRT